MKKALSSIINTVDELASSAYVSLFKEKSSLSTFLFHGLFNNENEMKLNFVNPQQGITINMFRQFIEYYLEHNYLFISPQDILNGLSKDKKYVLITLDDGYYNNHLALPVLKEYQVPATFFISSNHIAQNKCFWWDVVYRERRKKNATIKQIKKEITELKQKKNDKIERAVTNAFGEKALRPISDIDRPFTPAELKSFSKEPLVSLGNHTSDHAILTNYSHSEIKAEIADSQNSILSFTGITPIIISYPSGNFSEEVVTIAKEIGLKLGITVNQKKNYLPIDLRGTDVFLLNRFVLQGSKDIKKQCKLFRSDIRLRGVIKKQYKGENENCMLY